VSRVGPWTVPDRDEARRIVLQLKDSRWHITPAYYSHDGKWHARHGNTDLCSATLGGLMDECEDHVLLQQVAAGTLWDDLYVPGEPNFGPLASVLVFHQATGFDSRSRLPRHARLLAPRIYRPKAELPQRGTAP
jgi:hypothetical protein